MRRIRRLPDSTPASDLILRGHDRQAMHAMMDLHRRMARLLVQVLDDGSALHSGAHTLDGRRRSRDEREFLAAKVRRIEALVELIGGLL